MLYFRCRQLVGRVDLCPRADSPNFPLATSGARTFIDRRSGLHAEMAQSALPVIFKLVTGGLTNVILVVLGIINLQSRGVLYPFL